MKLRLGSDDKVEGRFVIGGVSAALVVGIGLYNIVPISSAEETATRPAVVATSTPTAVAAQPGADGDVALVAPAGAGVFGSGVAALQSNTTADEAVAATQAFDTVVPGPSCDADVVSAAADDARSRVSAVIGAPVPGTGLADLAAIAAGCSNADATGPVLSLALELSALVSSVPSAPAAVAPAATPAPAATGASPAVTLPDAVATTAVPTTVPTVTTVAVAAIDPGPPAGLVEALAPEADVIRAGCADVAYVGVAAESYPGGSVEIDGLPVQAAVAAAITLCALLDA